MKKLMTVSCISLSFSFGFFVYLAIETVYKSAGSQAPTHYSMGLLSGLAFVFLLWLDRFSLRFFVKMLLGALFITVGELVIGLYLNRYLMLGIWDYSELPFNFLGQICLGFSAVWILLCAIVILFNRFLLVEVKFLSHIN